MTSIKRLQNYVYQYKGNTLDHPDRDVSDYELLKMFGDFYVVDDPEIIDYIVGLFDSGRVKEGLETLSEYLTPDSPMHYRHSSIKSYYERVMSNTDL